MTKLIHISNHLNKKSKSVKKYNLMDFFSLWADKGEEVKRMKKMIEEDRKTFKLNGARICNP